MVMSCYKTRELYRITGENGEEMFPLLTFRFHTKDEHLVGILEEDFTDNKFVQKYRKRTEGRQFNGKIVIIKYQYGDGPAFNYYQALNRVQVHCKILNLD